MELGLENQTNLFEFMPPMSNRAMRPLSCSSTGDGRVKNSRLNGKHKKFVPIRDLLHVTPHCTVVLSNGQICNAEIKKLRGFRKTKHGKVQIYECEKGHKFSVFNLFYNYNRDAVETLLKSFINSGNLRRAIKDVKGSTGVELSRSKAIFILKYIAQLLDNFEYNSGKLRIDITELEAGEQYQPILKKDDPVDHGREKPHVWTFVVYDPVTYVIIATYVSKDRNENTITEVFKIVEKHTTTIKGKILRTDGLPAYEVAKDKFRVRLWSKSKKKDMSHINRIERLNRTLRESLNKHKSYSLDIFKTFLSLVRVYYNFFMELDSIGGKNPMESAFGVKFESWGQLIENAEIYAPIPTERQKGRQKKTVTLENFVNNCAAASPSSQVSSC
ncbi:MAG: hypothetical protein M1291_01205 [Thaumarchaeota archaeon]|nr:hypothetical protein [Nitrososphaerota archaeon]MDG6932706.1 DDE-type integrase/transposase/recombinase [Nitrososphaerota archaeon]